MVVFKKGKIMRARVFILAAGLTLFFTLFMAGIDEVILFGILCFWFFLYLVDWLDRYHEK